MRLLDEHRQRIEPLLQQCLNGLPRAPVRGVRYGAGVRPARLWREPQLAGIGPVRHGAADAQPKDERVNGGVRYHVDGVKNVEE